VAAHALAEQEAQRVAHAKAVADAQAQTVKERKLKEMKVFPLLFSACSSCSLFNSYFSTFHFVPSPFSSP
jgi:hypothetical protein